MVVCLKTVFYDKLIEENLKIPRANTVCGRELNYVFVGDEAFALRPDFLKPFNSRELYNCRRVYNDRYHIPGE